MRVPVRLRQVPPRRAAGVFLLRCGLSNRNAGIGLCLVVVDELTGRDGAAKAGRP